MLSARAYKDTTSAIRRREVLLWLACVLLANQLAVGLRDPGHGLIDAVTQLLLSKSVFYYLGWYAVFSLLSASNREQPVSGLHFAFAIAAALSNWLPAPFVVWLSTTAAATVFLVANRGDSAIGAAGAVLLALSFNGFWGPKFFDLFAFYVLHVDAVLVGATLSMTQQGMGWDGTIIGTPDAHRVLIYAPCSSFHNISLGLLCWVSITKLVRVRWVRGDAVFALLVCLAVLACNGSRLYLMALSPEGYAYWHTGAGEQVAAWITSSAVLAISLWGALRRTGPR